MQFHILKDLILSALWQTFWCPYSILKDLILSALWQTFWWPNSPHGWGESGQSFYTFAMYFGLSFMQFFLHIYKKNECNYYCELRIFICHRKLQYYMASRSMVSFLWIFLKYHNSEWKHCLTYYKNHIRYYTVKRHSHKTKIGCIIFKLIRSLMHKTKRIWGKKYYSCYIKN